MEEMLHAENHPLKVYVKKTTTQYELIDSSSKNSGHTSTPQHKFLNRNNWPNDVMHFCLSSLWLN